jgi:hypothetical protein
MTPEELPRSSSTRRVSSVIDAKREAYEALAEVVWLQHMERWKETELECERMWRD